MSEGGPPEAIQAVARNKSFQELANSAFADLLKKHDLPVGFKAALEASEGYLWPSSVKGMAHQLG
jgi:hypothetical protein